MSQPSPVNILSDDDESEHLNDVVSTPFAIHSKRRRTVFDSNPKTVFVIDDDPTPRKTSGSTSAPPFAAEDPMSDFDISIVKCTKVVSDPKFSGISGLICLESDNESDSVSGTGTTKQNAMPLATSEVEIISEFGSRLTECTFSLENSNMTQLCGDSSLDPFYSEYAVPQAHDFSDREMDEMLPVADVLRSKGKSKDKANKKKNMDESKDKQRTTKEERLCLIEKKRQQKEQEKLQKAALKAEALEMKKVQKEKQKWEKGKFALKSIVAEIDIKVVELGSVGGHLLTRFAEKGITFRTTSNPIERSIVWAMSVPKEISQGTRTVQGPNQI